MNDCTDSEELLDAALSKQIRNLCQQGYRDYDRGELSSAIRQFYSAWTKLPKPQSQWEEAGWVLTALGDAYFLKGDFENGRHALLSALHCPRASGNPFIHLRLGQCYFELDKTDLAREQFELVLAHAGEALLDREDRKYLNVIEGSKSCE